MRTTWRKSFAFTDSEEEAKQLCHTKNLLLTPYAKSKHYIATYTPWTSSDDKEHKFVVWFFENTK